MVTMSTATTADAPEDVSLVDPRAPRFGQAITATVLLVGVAFQLPGAVYAVATILLVATFSGWRLDLYASLWRRLSPVVGEPDEREPAAPHRFAKLLGVTGSVLASGSLLAGIDIVGYVIAAAVATAAGVAAVTGFCLGCRFYHRVEAARRLGLV